MALWAAVIAGCLLSGLAALGQEGRAGESRRDVLSLTPPPAAAPLLGRAASPLPQAPAGGSAVGGEEFGDQQIVARRAHVEPWSVSTGADVFYTSNAALASTHAQSDWYLRTGLAVAYTNRVRGPFFVDFSLEQYFFRYNRFDLLDFDTTHFEAAVLWQTPGRTDAFVFLRYRLERLTEGGFGSTLLTNHVGEIGVQKVWKISRGQQISAALTADLALDTDPGSGARDEYALSLGYSLRLTERLSAALAYRGAFYAYREGSRKDGNHILSAGLTYEVADWLRLGLSFAYTRDTSSVAFGDYESVVPGGSLGLHLSF